MVVYLKNRRPWLSSAEKFLIRKKRYWKEIQHFYWGSIQQEELVFADITLKTEVQRIKGGSKLRQIVKGGGKKMLKQIQSTDLRPLSRIHILSQNTGE